MDTFMAVLDSIDAFIWGLPMIVLLMGTGLLLTVRLNLLQITKLPRALKLILTAENTGEGDVSSFKSLCTALAATIGTGNIVGVATAVTAGGPGAIFWMWVAAFLGIATKYAEGLLAIKYRVTDANGQVSGGPMRYIEMGLGEKFRPLAIMFAVFGASAGILGIGTTTQAQAIISACEGAFDIPRTFCAAVLALLVAVVILGGLKSIANVASSIVPFMSVLYFVFGVGILIVKWDAVPAAFLLIIESAFAGHTAVNAAAGGFLGATFASAIRNGVARGIFSNEAGLGSAPIASAAAKTEWAAEQGLISMTGTFIDTIIICSITGLSLIVTGAWTGAARGAVMTQQAFASVYPESGAYILTICLVLFAFTTILGWAYYGERCMSYLCGVRLTIPYRLAYVAVVAAGPFLPLDVVWLVADITNGLMAFPNLIALIGLSGVVVAETKLYFDYLKDKGTTHIRKPE